MIVKDGKGKKGRGLAFPSGKRKTGRDTGRSTRGHSSLRKVNARRKNGGGGRRRSHKASSLTRSWRQSKERDLGGKKRWVRRLRGQPAGEKKKKNGGYRVTKRTPPAIRTLGLMQRVRKARKKTVCFKAKRGPMDGGKGTERGEKGEACLRCAFQK